MILSIIAILVAYYVGRFNGQKKGHQEIYKALKVNR
jgi:hypothetical protein